MSYKRGLFPGVMLVMLAALTGCLFPPSTIPMAARPVAQTEVGSAALIVFLHGRGGAPEDFETAGFTRIAADAGVNAQMLLANAHRGYYEDHTILTRLHEDIVAPARKRGQRVWLVGVSMGGTGALMYARQYPGEVEGVFAIAPFLGSGAEIREIRDAGGINAWSPGDREGIFPWEVWSWLKKRTASGDSGTHIYVGFGSDDRFARALPLLAGVLPEDRLLTAPGGHVWAAWAQLWTEFLTNRRPGLS